MVITYDILENLLKHNKGMKLDFRDNSSILDVFIYKNLILTLELDSPIIADHSEIIYNAITSLDGVTMYIPKIYIK